MQVTHGRHVVSRPAACVVMRVVRIRYLSLDGETKISHLRGCFLKLGSFYESHASIRDNECGCGKKSSFPCMILDAGRDAAGEIGNWKGLTIERQSSTLIFAAQKDCLHKHSFCQATKSTSVNILFGGFISRCTISLS